MSKNILKILPLFIIILIHNLCRAQSSVLWQETYPGIWKCIAGQKESISLLIAADIRPNIKALETLPKTLFPIDSNDIRIKAIDHKIYLRFPLEKNEQIFGLGLNFQTINQRGRILTLHMDHYGGQDNGRTHAPVPFYISSKGYGVLIDAARYITVYAGTGIRKDAKNPPVLYDRNTDPNWDPQPYSDAVEIIVPAEGAVIYIFGGPSCLNVVQRYNLMNGGGCLPPKWGLGFTQRVPTLYSQEDILHEVTEFEKHDFPLDFIGIEPGWQSMSYPCTYEWDKTRFPNPKALIDSLSLKGITTNLWLNPYVSPKSDLYHKIKNLSGSHTVWNGFVPDFTIQDVRDIFKDHFLKNHIEIGVGGYKIDEVDGFDYWLWPDVATFPSGFSSEQMRQIYGLLVQNMTTEWFKEKNRRTYGLVRGSNAGASSFPYVIYNDYYSHQDFITALVNSGFIGVLWTPEVRASDTAEEWLRRMQSVCFSPMAMINAWADGTKPWSFPEVEKAVREIANLRMQLLPYFYTAFAEYYFEGIPPFRAMNLVEGFGLKDNTLKDKSDTSVTPFSLRIRQDIKDQYMVGDNLLVAPMFAGQNNRKVILPPGKWYDFYTGEFVGEHQIIEVQPGLEKIPLFVKDGGIIPMVPVHRHAPSDGNKLPLEVRHYGNSDGQYFLYDDDGRTYNYEKGEYTYTKLIVIKDKNGKLTGSIIRDKIDKPYSYDNPTWRFMTK